MINIINRKAGILTLLLATSLISCKNKSEQSEQVISNNKKNEMSKVDKLPYFNTPDFAPTWSSEINELKELHKIPNFSFTNQLGKQVTNASLEGKIYVANFFFTSCPDVCIKLTKSMYELQDIYTGDDAIRLISHSVMPSVDTIEVLKEYGERHNINPDKWDLVTGDKEKTYALAREAYFADDLYKETKDKNRFVHTENLILIDKNSHIRGVYNGTLPEEVQRIKRHIALLKKE